MNVKWILAGVGAALALAGGGKAVVDTGILGRAFDFARAEAFALALPSGLRQWAPLFIAAARTYGVDPWVLAGICYNESLGGSALKPPGPTGTGDFTPRSTTSTTFRFANPNTGLPPDGLGWGRGLMQIDFGVHNAWVTTANWQDPLTNINKAASIFAEHLAYFQQQPLPGGIAVECWRINSGIPQIGISPWKSKYPGTYPACGTNGRTAPLRDPRPLSGAPLYEAAIAAYNAGPSGVLQALAMGLPAEAVTAGQQYVSHFAARLAVWAQKF